MPLQHIVGDKKMRTISAAVLQAAGVTRVLVPC
jgi:hypothetical protein